MNFLASSPVVQFSDIENWSFLIQIFYIAISLIIANILRRKIPFLRKSLIPTSIIAGLIILLIKSFVKYILGFESQDGSSMQYFLIDDHLMEVITYHTLGLGFVAVALKLSNKKDKKATMTVIDSGAITVGTYLIQAIVGLGITMLLYYIFKYGTNHFGWEANPLKWFSGLLLPLGFGQGTGQAGTWGANYEGLTENAFVGGTSYGLTIATIGFIVASLGGVIYLAWLRKKGLVSKEIIDHKDNNTLESYESKHDIPNTESVDKITIQFCLVLGTYALTFFLLYFIEKLIVPHLGNFGTNTLSPLLWGFNFLVGTIVATLVKLTYNLLRKKNIMKREYINNYLLDRLSGFFFDVMIVAGTAAINLNDLTKTWGSLILICVVGTITTFIYVLFTTKEVYKTYPHEGFLAMFGMLTGTASNGMILLREIDPRFETPMANNLVFQSLPAIVLGFPFLLLLSFACKSEINGLITFILVVIYFIAITIFIFRRRIFKKRKNKKL